MYFFFIVFAILIGLPGIILFILGLVHKRPIQWITGAVIIFASLIIVVSSIVTIINKSINTINKFNNLEKKHHSNPDYCDGNNSNEYSYAVNTEKERNVKEIKSEDKGVSGFIKGIDNKLTLIHVKNNKQSELNGISIDKIEDYTPQTIKRNEISLTLNFLNDFNGKLILTAYNTENIEVSESSISCLSQKGENKRVEFQFDKDVKFSEINYCILYQE
jgi:hypothetical protein